MKQRHSGPGLVATGLAGAGGTTGKFTAEEADRALIHVTGAATTRLVDLQASPDGGTTWFTYKRFTTGTAVAGLLAETFAVDPIPATYRFVNNTAGAGSTVDISVELLRFP